MHKSIYEAAGLLGVVACVLLLNKRVRPSNGGTPVARVHTKATILAFVITVRVI